MIKSIGKLTLAAILAAMVVGVPVRVSAQDKTNAVPATPAAPAKPKMTRFSGKLTKVDNTAKTITVDNKTKGERTFEITSDTKIMKDGKPATLSDAVVGDPTSGSYVEEDGKMLAKRVSFGAKPKPATSASATPPADAPAK